MTLIGRMVRELDFPVDIRVVPTVREPDGLAMSSRNVYLSPSERSAALSLAAALAHARSLWLDGEVDGRVLREAAAAVLERTPGVVAEYIAVVDPYRLAPVDVAASGTVVAVAARVGATRLIDNIILAKEAD